MRPCGKTRVVGPYREVVASWLGARLWRSNRSQRSKGQYWLAAMITKGLAKNFGPFWPIGVKGYRGIPPEIIPKYK